VPGHFCNDSKTSHLPRRASVWFPKIVTHGLSLASDGSVWCFPRELTQELAWWAGCPDTRVVCCEAFRRSSSLTMFVAVKHAARQVAGYNEREVMIASGATLQRANELMVRLHELGVISKK
jgi:hypothetical protein